METTALNFEVNRLGECRITSPISNIQFVGDNEHVLYHSKLEEIEGNVLPYIVPGFTREDIYMYEDNI